MDDENYDMPVDVTPHFGSCDADDGKDVLYNNEIVIAADDREYDGDCLYLEFNDWTGFSDNFGGVSRIAELQLLVDCDYVCTGFFC